MSSVTQTHTYIHARTLAHTHTYKRTKARSTHTHTRKHTNTDTNTHTHTQTHTMTIPTFIIILNAISPWAFSPFVDQTIRGGTWRSLHNVALGLLVSQRDGRHHVRAQVNAQNGDDSQRQRGAEQNVHQEGRDLWDVGRQCVGDRLLQVIKDKAPCQMRSSVIG